MTSLHHPHIKLPTNLTNPSTSPSTLACSNADMYASRRSTGITTYGVAGGHGPNVRHETSQATVAVAIRMDLDEDEMP